MNLNRHYLEGTSYIEEKALRKILRDLVGELPAFVKKQTPDGWEDTPFGHWFRSSTDHMGDEHLAGRFSMVLAQGLLDLTRFSALQAPGATGYLHIGSEELEDAWAEILGTTRAPLLPDEAVWDYMGDADNGLLLPFYELLFKIFDRNNYRWYYVDVPLYTSGEELYDLRDYFANNGPGDFFEYAGRCKSAVREYLKPYGVIPDSLELNDFEQIFDFVVNSGRIPPLVQSYRNAIDRWPDGYPFDRAVYKTIFDTYGGTPGETAPTLFMN